nr:MAG TPA: hypothetical protein [Caudoviricetes sp.]
MSLPIKVGFIFLQFFSNYFKKSVDTVYQMVYNIIVRR